MLHHPARFPQERKSTSCQEQPQPHSHKQVYDHSIMDTALTTTEAAPDAPPRNLDALLLREQASLVFHNTLFGQAATILNGLLLTLVILFRTGLTAAWVWLALLVISAIGRMILIPCLENART